jgi:hypothetical protein
MKRMLVVSSAFAALIALAVAASAQSKGADFSGTWALDKANSKLPQMMADRLQGGTWTIKQDATQLTREQKLDIAEGAGPGGGGGGGGRGGMMGGGGPLTVKLDGSETTAESPRGKSTTKAKWLDGGKILEVKTVTNASTQQGDFTLTSEEHWELADGGKTLKVHRTQETPRGKQESTWVFTKK